MRMAPIAKFGATSVADPGARSRWWSGGDLLLHEGQPAFVPPGRPHDDVHPLRQAVGDVVGRRVGHGELHDDVGSPEVPEVVVEVVGTDQAEVGSGPDRCANPGAHPARRADDRHRESAWRVGHTRSLTNVNDLRIPNTTRWPHVHRRRRRTTARQAASRPTAAVTASRNTWYATRTAVSSRLPEASVEEPRRDAHQAGQSQQDSRRCRPATRHPPEGSRGDEGEQHLAEDHRRGCRQQGGRPPRLRPRVHSGEHGEDSTDEVRGDERSHGQREPASRRMTLRPTWRQGPPTGTTWDGTT